MVTCATRPLGFELLEVLLVDFDRVDVDAEGWKGFLGVLFGH